MEKANQKIEDVLVSYLTGMATGEECDRAERWIGQNHENQKYFNQLRDIYESSKVTQASGTYNATLSWEKVKSTYYRNQVNRLKNNRSEEVQYFIREVLKYAAIIIVVSSLAVIGYQYMVKYLPAQQNVVWNQVEAPFGARTFVTLADGSSVWLNAGSKLKYPVNFDQNTREVILEGEAYFNVTKNKSRQFVVSTSHLKIRVYGTEFDVKAYPEENTIQTTLVKGAITLESAMIQDHGKHEILLKPNQSATFIKDLRVFKASRRDRKNDTSPALQAPSENLLIQPQVNPVLYTSWKDNRWIIEGETLSSLIVKLERRFNVKFDFQSESLKNYRFSGTLKEESLEQVLNIIKISAPIEYTVKDNWVHLRENKSFKKTYDEMLMNTVN